MRTNQSEIEQRIIVDRNQLEKGKLYIHIFHGRTDLNENLENWGSELGYLEIDSLSYTYDTLRLNFPDDSSYELLRQEDLIEFQKIYYGDFCVFVKE